MATIQGFTDGSYDYKHMYNIKDLHGPFPIPKFNPNTLLGYLHSENHPFADIIERTPLAATYNDPQGDFSLFVPSFIDEQTKRLDSYHLRQLVLYHTLEHAVPYQFLSTSGCMKVATRLPGSRLIVENINVPTPFINRCAQVTGYTQIGNASIFFINRVLKMDNNPLSNSDI